MNINKEVTLTVSNPAIHVLGRPVMCHGLKSATDLNGKVGDLLVGIKAVVLDDVLFISMACLSRSL